MARRRGNPKIIQDFINAQAYRVSVEVQREAKRKKETKDGKKKGEKK